MCDAANNWTLHCEPSQNKPSKWDTCPSMKCQGAEGLSIGNSTAAGCNRSTCAYAGFDNSTIMTTLVQDSSSCSRTTSPPSNDVSRINSNWDCLFILVLLGFHSSALQLGKFKVIIGEIANFAAYAYAPAILVTPLEALSIIFSLASCN